MHGLAAIKVSPRGLVMPFTQVLLATGACADCAGTRDGAPANSVAAVVSREPGKRKETKVAAAAPCRPYVRRRPGRHPRRLPVAGCQRGRSAAPGAGDHGDAYVTQHGGHVVSRGMHLKRQVCPKRRTHFKIL